MCTYFAIECLELKLFIDPSYIFLSIIYCKKEGKNPVGSQFLL